MTDEIELDVELSETLHGNGGSDGVSIHVPAETARTLGLESGDSATVAVVVEDGSPVLRTEFDRGFSQDDFVDFAREHEWKQLVDEEEIGLAEEGEWGYAYATPEYVVIDISNRYQVNGKVVNNLTIRSIEKKITDIDEYRRAREVDVGGDRWLWTEDPQGLLSQLDGSPRHDKGRPFDIETIERAIEEVGHVTVEVVDARSSLATTLQSVEEAVEQVAGVANQLPGEWVREFDFSSD